MNQSNDYTWLVKRHWRYSAVTAMIWATAAICWKYSGIASSMLIMVGIIFQTDYSNRNSNWKLHGEKSAQDIKYLLK